MPTLPEFRLETHFAKWEFKARYHMTASDAHNMSLRDLLALASPEERAEFDDMWLGYTETFGAPDLRATFAATFADQPPENILCFAGASEGIFAANNVILDANLPKWDAFFARHGDLFTWRRPDGSCMAFPRYNGADGVEAFAQSLVEDSGVLLLPGSIYASDLGETPANHFRLGFGRLGLDEGLAALDAHILRNRS